MKPFDRSFTCHSVESMNAPSLQTLANTAVDDLLVFLLHHFMEQNTDLCARCRALDPCNDRPPEC
jgi:hypothetical protein